MTTPDASSGTFARREAQPIPWGELSDDQKEAAEQACRILAELANQKYKSPLGKPPRGIDLFLPPIDAERLNHVILIDGERGSGKTALLVTLIDAWNRALRSDDEDRAKIEDGFHSALKGTERIVVPIGIVDLQPLHSSANLLIYLVGRFQRVVEAIEQVYSDRSPHRDKGAPRRDHPAPWNALDPEEPLCAAKWRDFLQASALGWSGGLEGRRSTLDPEAFALEIEEAERRRLDVVSSFRALIDALLDDFRLLDVQIDGKLPLFLLAIDDADMHPDKAVELLDLVRTLWHPRVAFLMTGDRRLFLAKLRHLLKDKVEYRDKLSVDELVGDIYNKSIPPTHHCALPRLDPDKRLELLRGSLEKLSGPEPRTNTGSSRLLGLERVRQMREALPGRPRSISDLKGRIENIIADARSGRGNGNESADTDTVLGAIAAICRAAYYPWMDQLGQPWRNGEDLSDWLKVAQAARELRWVASPMAAYLPTDEEGWSLVVQKQPRWAAFTKNGQVVPDQMIAAAMLASDAADGILRGRVALRPLGRLGLAGVPVRMQYQEGGQAYSFAWPLPNWSSFEEFAKFGEALAPHVPSVESYNDRRLDELARRFVQTVLDMSLKLSASDLMSWEELAAQVGKAAHVRGVVRDWAVRRVGLFAMPESGLGKKSANIWCEALRRTYGNWDEMLGYLQKERISRVRVEPEDGGVIKSLDGYDADELLHRIDRELPGYTWSERRANSGSGKPSV